MVLTRVLLLVFYELFLSIDLTSTQFTQFTTTATWLPNQCHQYTIINDRTRNVNANGSNECDTLFMSGSSWVRFIGESGTQLTTTPTNPNQCGAHSTGWYAGSMPDIYQTVTNGRVCFSWYNNICQWSNTIAVTNCGSFYIYQLTMPPLCAARYCTDTTNIPTATTTTTSIQPILSPQCYHYSTIDDPTRNVNYATGSNCDQRFFNSTPTWFRFEGVGGTQMPTSATTYNRCGTQATGWYSGQMPTYLDTTTNGTVCFAWQSNTCYGSQSIRVTNCGSYYVYELSAPSGCNYRYCTIHSSSVRQSNVASTSISNYIQSLVTKIGTMKEKILNKLAAIM